MFTPLKREKYLSVLWDIGNDSVNFAPLYQLFLRYDTNETAPRPETWQTLDELVMPYLRRPSGWAEIYAFTDPTGSDEVNDRVSRERLVNVQQFLANGVPAAKAFDLRHKYFGEAYARAEGLPNGSESSHHRLVTISLYTDVFAIPALKHLQFAPVVYGRFNPQPEVK
jgi:outer membrane protein OmpA-like peptidoglycan-associated protein